MSLRFGEETIQHWSVQHLPLCFLGFLDRRCVFRRIEGRGGHAEMRPSAGTQRLLHGRRTLWHFHPSLTTVQHPVLWIDPESQP